MDATGNRRLNAYLQLGFAFIIFLSLNLLGNAFTAPVRMDFTSDRLFTLSPGTREILGHLEEPLTFRFYFSETAAANDPEIFRYGRRVKSFLEEFEALSQGKIHLEVIDPEPFSEEIEEAEAYGVQGIALDDNIIYLGMVGFDETNRLEVIAHFSEERERFLEFDLAKIVYLLSQQNKTKVGLISALPMRYGTGGAMAFLQGRGQPYLIYSQLTQLFDVTYLENYFNVIPGDVDVLLVVHPPEMTAEQLYQIDQFILKGKPALIFVDPFAEVTPLLLQTAGGAFGDEVSPSSNLAQLFAAWGIGYSPDRAVVDYNLGQRVEVGNPPQVTYRDYIHWLGVRQEQLSAESPITAFLSTVNFASAGVLDFDGRAGLSFEPLIETSDGADIVAANLVREDIDPGVLVQVTNPKQKFTLAGRLFGAAKSAYPEGLDGKKGVVEGDINVIIGADADIFEDRFWAGIQGDGLGREVLVPIADNAAFIVNALDYLGGSEALISLRARGVSKRPLEKFQALRREATRREEEEKQSLRARLREVESRLSELQQSTPEGQAYSDASEVEVRSFRNQAEAIERNLNQVQRTLLETIRGMQNRIIFLNMFIIPALLLLLALGRFAMARRRERS